MLDHTYTAVSDAERQVIELFRLLDDQAQADILRFLSALLGARLPRTTEETGNDGPT